MARVAPIKKWAEARPYLEELKTSISDDIRTLLDTRGSAPFAIAREVLSYIDHLGHLYTGRRAISTRSLTYLTDVMSKIDGSYAVRAGELYEMYRHGSVHEFAPKLLQNRAGQSLYWLCFKGPRTATICIQGRAVEATHLQPVGNSTHPHFFWLPVSTLCLIEDLERSIDELTKAGPEADRVTAWNAAARELSGPRRYEFKL